MAPGHRSESRAEGRPARMSASSRRIFGVAAVVLAAALIAPEPAAGVLAVGRPRSYPPGVTAPSVPASGFWVDVSARPAIAGRVPRISGEVRGIVVDAGSGAPIAGAEVRLIAVDAAVAGARAATGAKSAESEGVSGSAQPMPTRVALTARDGTWSAGPVEPGRYRIVVQQIGYGEQEQAIEVGPGQAVSLRIRLTPRPLSLDAVVVTASRRLQRLKDVPVATELVSRREIRESGAPDLSAVLIERTGVTLQGGHPSGAGVMIQGFGSERVLVLLDGQPFIGRLSGQLDLSRIPTSMIERIEVVKGPQSTLYGSEAMGGVVNVITRSPERGVWSGGAALTGGTHGRLDVGANLLGGVGPVAYTVDAGRRAVELVPGQAGESGALAERWDGLAKVQWQASSSLSLSASGLFLDERQRWQTGQLYHFADNRQWGARVGGAWTGGAHRLAPTLYATEFEHLPRQATTPEPVAGTGEDERQRLFEAELLYGYTGDLWALDAGIEARRETIVSERVVGGDRELHAVEPFVQATFTGERWSVVPGVRLSWSEPWGTHWTPRVAALFRPFPRLALRASMGLGYRAPGFKELYMEFLNTGPGFGYTVRGNPDLQPETSRNATIGAEWTGDWLYLKGQLFHNRFEDFIETHIVGDSSGIDVYTYGNVDDGTTRGIELEAGVARGGLRLEGGYAYLHAERSGTGEPLLGRPAHSLRGSASYAVPLGLRVSLTAVRTGDTPVRRTEAGVIEREGFTRFDVRVAQALPLGFELSAGLDNVFDVRPEEWPGHMGRQFYLTVQWQGERDAR